MQTNVIVLCTYTQDHSVRRPTPDARRPTPDARRWAARLPSYPFNRGATPRQPSWGSSPLPGPGPGPGPAFLIWQQRSEEDRDATFTNSTRRAHDRTRAPRTYVRDGTPGEQGGTYPGLAVNGPSTRRLKI